MSADGCMPRQFVLGLDDEIIVDLFAGGGGMSEGIQRATGRHVDVAVNHDADAISMHEANHPQTLHYKADVFEVNPREVMPGRPIGLLHLSPDCTHHSQAAGGQPRDKKIRALSWIGLRWAAQRRPRVVSLENVKQIRQWCPLIAKRCKVTGRVMRLDGSVAAVGERVPVQQQFLIPNPKRRGETWNKFCAGFRELGYVEKAFVSPAADFGAATTRERLHWIARCDGEPIVSPDRTHHKAPAKGQKKWRAAAECIDWSIKSLSIFATKEEAKAFGRANGVGTPKRPLEPATLRRVAAGTVRYVIEAENPFIVPTDHGIIAPHLQQFTQGGRIHDIRKTMPTITTAKGGEQMLIAPVLVQTGYGERAGQAPRALDLGKPLGVVVAGGGKHALVTAFLAQHNTMPKGRTHPGHAATSPLSSITQTGSQQGIVTEHLAHFRGNCDGRDLRDPLQTISAGGEHHAIVECTLSKEHEAGALRCAAFLMKFYSSGGQWSGLSDPMAAITTKDRMALVTVYYRGSAWLIVDICLRMLTPRELYNAQGFPPNYIIDRGHDGRKFTGAQKIRMCGNSVSPYPAEAYIRANYQPIYGARLAA